MSGSLFPFSLLFALGGLDIPGAGIKSSVLYSGYLDARMLGLHSMDREEMKKDRNSESCQWRALQNSFPKSWSP